MKLPYTTTQLQEFRRFVKRRNTILTLWQEEVAEKIFRQPPLGGKSFLIKMLYEFERGDER